MNAARLSETMPVVASICFNNFSSMGTWTTLLLLFCAIILLTKLCNLIYMSLHNIRHFTTNGDDISFPVSMVPPLCPFQRSNRRVQFKPFTETKVKLGNSEIARSAYSGYPCRAF